MKCESVGIISFLILVVGYIFLNTQSRYRDYVFILSTYLLKAYHEPCTVGRVNQNTIVMRLMATLASWLALLLWLILQASESNNHPINIRSTGFHLIHWHSNFCSENLFHKFVPYFQFMPLLSKICKHTAALIVWQSEIYSTDLWLPPITSTDTKGTPWRKLCFLNNNSCINMRSSQLKGNQHQKAVKHRTLNPSFFEETRLKRGVSSYGWMKWEFSCNKRTSSPMKN